MNPILECKHLSYSYHSMAGETPAISNMNFQISQGDFLAIVGPSGCGKSTLLSLICGLLTPESGEIRYKQRLIQPGDYHCFGYMLQKDHLFEWRSIQKNILLGLEIQHKLTPDSIAYADSLLETYGLTAFAGKRPSELSGGMRQRAALIRTLVLKPDLLLLDEPFSALDYQTRLQVSDDIGKIIRREGKTAILVTHDLSEAISMGTQVLVLSRRPGTCKACIPILLDPGLSPIEKRNCAAFKDYFDQIWKEFESNEQLI